MITWTVTDKATVGDVELLDEAMEKIEIELEAQIFGKRLVRGIATYMSAIIETT